MKTPRLAINAAMLAALLSFGACSRPHEIMIPNQLPTATVRVETIEIKKFLATEEVVGTVRPKLRSVIEAKLSGRIEKMLVTPGQKVKTRDVLAQLDVREIRAKLEQANAVLQQAERDLQRFALLRRQQAVTQQEYDAVEARHRVARGAVAEAETILDYSTITAPFDGIITRKLADVGDLASPGRPLLEMEDPSVLRLEADLPEAIVERVQLGAKMAVHAAALPDEMEGTVSEIAPAADPGSRTFLVKLDLPAVPGLRAGQFGRVAVPTHERAALRVNASALVRRGQMEMVFVVISRHAQLRLVKSGKRVGSDVELVSGVNAGEHVVIDHAADLADGQPVEVKP